MADEIPGTCRYFLSYTGIKLPLKLLAELEPEQLENRNTCSRGYFDEAERLINIRKLLHGEVEMQHHRRRYDPSGSLSSVEIADVEGEVRRLKFTENGETVPGGGVRPGKRLSATQLESKRGAGR